MLHHKGLLVSLDLDLCLLLFLHLLEELFLLLMLFHLVSCFLEARQYFFFLVEPQTNGFTFRKSTLHWPLISLLRYQHSLLVQVCDGLLRSFYGCHAHKGATHAAR